MPSWSLRLPAQILRHFQKIMLAGKLDSDIKYMAVLIFQEFLDFKQNAYSQTSS